MFHIVVGNNIKRDTYTHENDSCLKQPTFCCFLNFFKFINFNHNGFFTFNKRYVQLMVLLKIIKLIKTHKKKI